MFTNNSELKFVKHFIGFVLLIIGLLGIVLPIIPGLILIGASLALLQEIKFFKDIKDKIEEKMQVILPSSIREKIIKKETGENVS